MSEDTILPILFRWVHLLAAVVAIGGAFFARFALVPAMSQTLSKDDATRLRDAIASRWRIVLFTAITLLLVSGLYNFYIRISAAGDDLPAAYHPLFGVKLLLALVVFFLASALAGRSAALARIRENGPFWLGTVALLGFVIVMLGGVLKHLF